MPKAKTLKFILLCSTPQAGASLYSTHFAKTWGITKNNAQVKSYKDANTDNAWELWSSGSTGPIYVFSEYYPLPLLTKMRNGGYKCLVI